ncbi:MAG: hypothetical protein HY718_11075, partial [Planctomycetes bacterium]|nr:hypothetical protein [Planctomycetota bacterium]
MRRRWMLPSGCVLVVLAGCNRDPNPPLKFADGMEGPGGRKLMAIDVPDRKGDTVLGPIA